MASVSYGSLPFAEQIAFFRKKLNIPTTSWTDIYSREHDYAFVVAGANRDDLLADFRTAVDKAIADGTTLEQFRKDFDSIVAKYGWDYNGGREWRSRVIYETNLFSSYNAGRYEQLQAQTAALPYWRYRHSDAVEEPREEHVKWNNLVLRADDPWWRTHYPPNGWGCQCYVEGLTEDDLRALGKTGPDKAPALDMQTQLIGKRSPGGPFEVQVPAGIDPSFEHAPGQSRLQSAIPPERPALIDGSTGSYGLPNRPALDELPPARALTKEMILPTNQPAGYYATEFLQVFGATLAQPAVFKDVTGAALVMGSNLFTDAKGRLKDNKRDRGQYMRVLAQGVLEPDEIWVRMEYLHGLNKNVVRRRYIARFQLPGQDVLGIAVWEQGKDGWDGVTVYDDNRDVNLFRIGTRIYKRGQ
ncbi:PBECR2 nuclease fold domain-containing protein [Rheinheimera gaetbuli]